MDFTALFLFFFGAIGIFNSLLISIWFLFFKKAKQVSDTLFGCFLLFLSERALRSLIYFFSDMAPNMYSALGPVTFFFIGPFLFLYVLSVVKPGSKTLALWKYHILFWIVIVIGTHFIYPFRSDPIFYKKYILKGINIQWVIYILISGGVVFRHITTRKPEQEKFNAVNLWLFFLLLGVAVLWLIYFFISFSYFVIGSITFSILFYCFFLFFILNKKKRAQIFRGEKKYSDKKIDPAKAIQLVQKLEALMQEQKLYKNPNLKSSDIAKELNSSTHQFSQLLNDNLGKSFSVFISEYRIEEAKQMIRSNTKYTLEAIGNESGFHSKSTFYTTFKRIVGMTPSKYKAQL